MSNSICTFTSWSLSTDSISSFEFCTGYFILYYSWHIFIDLLKIVTILIEIFTFLSNRPSNQALSILVKLGECLVVLRSNIFEYYLNLSILIISRFVCFRYSCVKSISLFSARDYIWIFESYQVFYTFGSSRVCR